MKLHDYKKDLLSQNWENVTQETDINKAWNIFKSQLKSVINKHAPLAKKKLRGRDCPWLTNGIK